MAPSLEVLAAELELLSQRYSALIDPFGTLAAVVEGGWGGRTSLLWLPWERGPEALVALERLPFRGRVVLALSPLFEDEVPFLHLSRRFAPEFVLVGHPGRGTFGRFSGYKLVAPGEKAPLDDPRPPLTERRLAPTGLSYLERREYRPWRGKGGPGEGPHLGAGTGALPIGVGLDDLEESLKEALASSGQL